MEDFEQLDYYELLGVSRSATADEIKRAYRQQMSRFHPDRYAGASPAEQAYASRRSQRINEAYRVLSDFTERNAYNRGAGSAGRTIAAGPRQPAAPPPPSPPRDHLAELYDQAREHLAAGRNVQAAATLRELQRLNPFYRDSAALLEQAEAAGKAPARAPAAPGAPDRGRRSLIAGAIGGIVLLGAGAAGWALRRGGGPQGSAAAPSPAPASPVAVAGGLSEATVPPAATAPAEPSPAPAEPSSTAAPPSPTAAPPTASPTSPPASPTSPPPSPTAVPPSPTAAALAEEGELAYADDFGGARSWPQIDNGDWSVGYADGAYQITAQPGLGNIWAYRTSPIGDRLQVGVDLEVAGGEAGLLLRFSEAGRYLAFMLNPAGRFRLEDRTGRSANVLVDEASPAIQAGEGARNRLLARLDGDRIELRINGQPVADLSRASPPPAPLYGFVAIGTEREVVARFDNLELRAVE